LRRQRTTRGTWDRIARSVMRRPVLYLIAVAAILLGVAAPFLRAEVGGFDERVLPAGTPSRTVAERIATDFPGGGLDPIVVMVRGASPAGLATYRQEVARLPGVTGASVYAAN